MQDGLLLVRYALLHMKNKQMYVSWRKSSETEKQQLFLRVNLISHSTASGPDLVSSIFTLPLKC